jgi:hypothetical protein
MSVTKLIRVLFEILCLVDMGRSAKKRSGVNYAESLPRLGWEENSLTRKVITYDLTPAFLKFLSNGVQKGL